MSHPQIVRYFSAFAGIGGFDLGIEQAIPSAVCVGFSEIDKHAIKIYTKHYTDRVNFGDIRKIKTQNLPEFDIFCGGFPCQDVSVAGKRAGLCGARSGLFFDIVKIIRKTQPELILLENVKGLFSSNEGWDFARILTKLDGCGYDVEWQLLNSKNFGVPQNRERVFIIGHLRGKTWKPVFPLGKNDSKTVQEEPAEKEMEQTAQCLTNRAYSNWDGNFIIAKCLTGGGHSGGLHSDMNIVISDSGFGRTNQIRTETVPPLRSNSGCGHNNKLISGKTIRRLTPLECERLQGFPDEWTNGISNTQRYKCLGNAVTVPVVSAVVSAVVA